MPPENPWTISSNLEDMNIIEERPGRCLSAMESENVITSSRDREGVICPGTVTRCNRRHHVVVPYDIDERVLFLERTAKAIAVEERDGILLPCDSRKRRSRRQRPGEGIDTSPRS